MRSYEGPEITGYTVASFVMYSTCITELGDGWAPVLMETEKEYDWLIEKMGLFFSTYDIGVFIGGYTNASSIKCNEFYSKRIVQYSGYRTTKSGNTKIKSTDSILFWFFILY